MNHGSLFSGIGGFDLAAEWMGWQNKFHCEWNEFGQKVLHYYWPEAEQFTDITKTDFTKYANRIDILTGGFPCQPYSLAGKRKGKEDERHLWPSMLRAIKEIQPRWVVGENVFGLINWNGGLVFHEVQADLEAAGYEVWPYVLPACAVNAPHRRDRVWFVAYRNDAGNTALRSGDNGNGQTISIQREQPQPESCRPCNEGNATYPDSGGLERAEKIGRNSINVERQGKFRNVADPNEPSTKHSIQTGGNLSASSLQQDATNANSDGQHGSNSEHEINPSEGREYAQRNIEQSGSNGVNPNTDNERLEGYASQRVQGNEGRRIGIQNGILAGVGAESGRCGNNWQNFPTQSPICGRNDELSERLDGITFSKWRNESIKAYGNAVVPQVVYQIFKAIEAYESANS